MPQLELLDPGDIQAARQRADRLSRLLDTAFVIPGTRIRFGVDALLGLVPGIGDLAGLLLGAWILVEALRLGAPFGLLLRMVGNLLLDTLLGSVPVFGDIFDVSFRANRRNAGLLFGHLDQVQGVIAEPERRIGRAVVAWTVLGLMALAGGVWLLTRWLGG